MKNRKAEAFLDFTRAGPLKHLVVVAELVNGERYSVAYVAEYPEDQQKAARAHAKKIQAALDFVPKARPKGKKP